MINAFKNGWIILRISFKIFKHHPKFIIPLLVVWMIYAPIVLHLTFWFPWEVYSSTQIFPIMFSVLFIFSLLLTFSCSMLLELIQQLESGEKMSISKSIRHTIGFNFLAIAMLAFAWAVVWFVLLIIQSLSSKGKGRVGGRERVSFSTQNAAVALGTHTGGSWFGFLLGSLEKGLRMFVFLTLPAVAWEGLSFRPAIKRGRDVFEKRFTEFGTGFALTGLAILIFFLPPAIISYLANWHTVIFPDWVWWLTILYTAFMWSYSIYLEQMFTAELYLWHLWWEKEVAKAQQENRPIPEFSAVPAPSIFDDIYEFNDDKKTT